MVPVDYYISPFVIVTFSNIKAHAFENETISSGQI